MASLPLTSLADKLLQHCSRIEQTEIPDRDATNTPAARQEALDVLAQLTAQLQGPHEYLHELVSSNWDHGALYAALQSQALDHVAAAGGHASLQDISSSCGVPADKLVRILGLLRCRYIVDERPQGQFHLTPVAEYLIAHPDFRSWVEFQLYETRVASAHLADALARRPNDFASGASGFREAWGTEMYEWHARHPDKGDRFRRAMKGVSTSLDPADELIQRYMQDGHTPDRTRIVEFGGRYGLSSIALAQQHPSWAFEIRANSPEILHQSRNTVPASVADRFTFTEVASSTPAPLDDRTVLRAYIIRNMLWNQSNEAAVSVLRSLLPILEPPSPVTVLVTDGYSPTLGDFEPHVELAYRRRDITTMTMHNAKQRTQAEWLALFAEADPRFQVRTMQKASSHVCKGLWVLNLPS